MKAVQLMIEGRVQGVGYRYFCKKQASTNGISGWVRNTENGSVEVMAQGEEEEISVFLRMLRKGPPGSQVEEVIVEDREPGEYQGFQIHR